VAEAVAPVVWGEAEDVPVTSATVWGQDDVMIVESKQKQD